jgi:hypothetical protein
MMYGQSNPMAAMAMTKQEDVSYAEPESSTLKKKKKKDKKSKKKKDQDDEEILATQPPVEESRDSIKSKPTSEAQELASPTVKKSKKEKKDKKEKKEKKSKKEDAWEQPDMDDFAPAELPGDDYDFSTPIV